MTGAALNVDCPECDAIVWAKEIGADGSYTEFECPLCGGSIWERVS